jgi:hypothetical protein
VAIPGWQILLTGCNMDVSFPMGAGGQEAEVVHGAGPIFGRPCGSGNTGAGYGAEGWCVGGDESVGGGPEQPFTNTGAEAVAPADGVIADAGAVMVFVPAVCTFEVCGAIRRGPMPRQVREDRLANRK